MKRPHDMLVAVITLGIVVLGSVFLSRNWWNQRSVLRKTELEEIDRGPTSSPAPPLVHALGSSYQDPSGRYELRYPSDFTLDTSDPIHPRLYKKGPTQRGQTEMYDGVIVVFETIDLAGKRIKEWVDMRISTDTAAGASQLIQVKTPLTLNTYPGLTYQIRGLGEFTNVVIQKSPETDQALLITYMVADPQNVGFQSQVDAILSSIQLHY